VPNWSQTLRQPFRKRLQSGTAKLWQLLGGSKAFEQRVFPTCNARLCFVPAEKSRDHQRGFAKGRLILVEE